MNRRAQKHLAPVALAALALAGCATPHPGPSHDDQVEAVLKPYVGQDIRDFLHDAKFYPTRRTPLPTGEVLYIFSEYHMVPVPDTGSHVVTWLPMAWAPGEDEARCEVRLTVRPSGMISDYAWRGTDCVD